MKCDENTLFQRDHAGMEAIVLWCLWDRLTLTSSASVLHPTPGRRAMYR